MFSLISFFKGPANVELELLFATKNSLGIYLNSLSTISMYPFKYPVSLNWDISYLLHFKF